MKIKIFKETPKIRYGPQVPYKKMKGVESQKTQLALEGLRTRNFEIQEFQKGAAEAK